MKVIFLCNAAQNIKYLMLTMRRFLSPWKRKQDADALCNTIIPWGIWLENVSAQNWICSIPSKEMVWSTRPFAIGAKKYESAPRKDPGLVNKVPLHSCSSKYCEIIFGENFQYSALKSNGTSRATYHFRQLFLVNDVGWRHSEVSPFISSQEMHLIQLYWKSEVRGLKSSSLLSCTSAQRTSSIRRI